MHGRTAPRMPKHPCALLATGQRSCCWRFARDRTGRATRMCWNMGIRVHLVCMDHATHNKLPDPPHSAPRILSTTAARSIEGRAAAVAEEPLVLACVASEGLSLMTLVSRGFALKRWLAEYAGRAVACCTRDDDASIVLVLESLELKGFTAVRCEQLTWFMPLRCGFGNVDTTFCVAGKHHSCTGFRSHTLC